jgi:hypothetical protein
MATNAIYGKAATRWLTLPENNTTWKATRVMQCYGYLLWDRRWLRGLSETLQSEIREVTT